jgi:hypothetical protein
MMTLHLTDIESMVARARNHYRVNRDPGHPTIEKAEDRINADTPAVTLAKGVEAGYLVHPAGTAHFYILLTPPRADARQ